MPLIDLLNNKPDFFYYYGGPGNFTQRNLPFDKDMPGGGNSGLPYVQFPIDSTGVSDNFRKYYSTNRTGLDFPVRGGSLVFDLGNQTFTPSADFDKQRISRFLKDDPKGQSFLLKQQGLQLSNPKIQTGDTIYTLRTNSIPSLIPNNQLFNNGRNLLAQVGVQGTGTHISRIGAMPYNPLEKFYQDVVGAEKTMENKDALENNRLLILTSLKMKSKTTANQVSTLGDVENIVMVNKLGISLNRNILFQYLGGPGSVYGIGSTTIRRSKDADTTEAINFKTELRPTTMTTLGFTYDMLMQQSSSAVTKTNEYLINSYGDFRDSIKNYSGGKISGSNWGKNTDQRIDVRFFDGSGRVDKMNKSPVFTFASDTAPWTTQGKEKETDDIIKFVFECIHTDNTKLSDAIFFRAYLTAITDSNSAQWNGFKYMGRGESFYTYGGFDRSISFGFKVAVGAEEELEAIYRKVNFLMSQVYPDYSKDGYMRAPIIKLTIGDYLYRVPGFLENINVTIDQSSPWEIEEGNQLPHYIDISTSFKPILNKLPQRIVAQDTGKQVDLIRQKKARSSAAAGTLQNLNPNLINAL